MGAGPSQTVGDLRQELSVLEEEIDAAVDAFLSDPSVAPFRFGNGHSLGVAKALHARPPSRLIYADVHARPADERKAVQAAIRRAKL